MLERILIKQFAIIDQLEGDFHSSFSALTVKPAQEKPS